MENVATPPLTFDRRKIQFFLLDHIIEVCLIVLIVGLSFGANGFMSWANWMNILRANSLKGVIAFGMTMVIIAGLIERGRIAIVGVVYDVCRGELFAALRGQGAFLDGRRLATRRRHV